MFEFELGIPTFSDFDEDGFLGVQVDVYGDGSEPTGCPAGELQTPYGFQCRPLDPTVGPDGVIDPAESGQCLYFWDGGRLHVIPTQDPRVVRNLPALKKGESMTYGPRNNFVRCCEDGSVVQFCSEDGTANGRSIWSRVALDRFERIAPWGSERWGWQGYHLVTKSGARLDIGPSGMPAPFGGSSATLAGDSVSIDGELVSLGNPNLLQDKVARSTALLAWLASWTVDRDAIQAALGGLAGAGSPPPQQQWMNDAQTALNDISSALTIIGGILAAPAPAGLNNPAGTAAAAAAAGSVGTAQSDLSTAASSSATASAAVAAAAVTEAATDAIAAALPVALPAASVTAA